MRQIVLGAAVFLGLCGAASAEPWPVYTSKQFGLKIAYPGHLVDYSQSRPARGEFALKGGGLLIFTKDALGGQKLKTFLHGTLLRDVDVTYSQQKGNWMAYSGYVGSQIVYGRSHLSCGGQVAHSFIIRYPKAERATYDRVVERLSHSLQVAPGFDGQMC